MIKKKISNAEYVNFFKKAYNRDEDDLCNWENIDFFLIYHELSVSDMDFLTDPVPAVPRNKQVWNQFDVSDINNPVELPKEQNDFLNYYIQFMDRFRKYDKVFDDAFIELDLKTSVNSVNKNPILDRTELTTYAAVHIACDSLSRHAIFFNIKETIHPTFVYLVRCIIGHIYLQVKDEQGKRVVFATNDRQILIEEINGFKLLKQGFSDYPAIMKFVMKYFKYYIRYHATNLVYRELYSDVYENGMTVEKAFEKNNPLIEDEIRKILKFRIEREERHRAEAAALNISLEEYEEIRLQKISDAFDKYISSLGIDPNDGSKKAS